jgi:hypothetical protein
MGRSVLSCELGVGVKRSRMYGRTEFPVQLSQPQEVWCTGIPVGESPDPEDDDEKDLVWDEPEQVWG